MPRKIAKIAGIDPGSSGALVFIDVDIETDVIIAYERHKMPDNLKREDLGCNKVAQIIKDNLDYEYCLEKVHAYKGAAKGTSFSFGENYGIIKGVLCALDLVPEWVSPVTWQRAVWEKEDIVFDKYKNGKIKKTNKTKKPKIHTKETSKNAAKRIYPGIDLTKSKRSYKEDDGVADAFCMAWYLYCKKYKKV